MKRVGVLILIVLCWIPVTAQAIFFEILPYEAAPTTFVVGTYNIQSGRNSVSVLRLNETIDTIRQLSVSILALNEVKMGCEDAEKVEQARVIAEAVSMNWVFAKTMAHSGGEYGVALLSRYPILSYQVIPIPSVPEGQRDYRYEDRVILRGVLDIDGKPVTVLVTHLGLVEAEQKNGLATLRALVEDDVNPVIVLGDLNIRPYDPQLYALTDTLVDTAGSNANLFTYKSTELKRRLDYILVSRHFLAEDTWTVPSTASDHLPLLARLTLA